MTKQLQPPPGYAVLLKEIKKQDDLRGNPLLSRSASSSFLRLMPMRSGAQVACVPGLFYPVEIFASQTAALWQHGPVTVA